MAPDPIPIRFPAGPRGQRTVLIIVLTTLTAVLQEIQPVRAPFVVATLFHHRALVPQHG